MSKKTTPSRCAGVVATACTQGKRTQHGRPQSAVRDDPPDTREGQAGRPGEAERSAVPFKPGNAGGGKGPQFKTNARRSEGPGDWATYQLRKVFRSCRWRCTRKRRQKPAIASMPCTTRSAARIFWCMPMPSAALTRAHRAWTAGTLRTSRRMGSSGGWPNWRLRSGRRLTDQSRSDACVGLRHGVADHADRGEMARHRCQDHLALEPHQQLTDAHVDASAEADMAGCAPMHVEFIGPLPAPRVAVSGAQHHQYLLALGHGDAAKLDRARRGAEEGLHGTLQPD